MVIFSKDERIPGDSEFVEQLLIEVQEAEQHQKSIKRSGITETKEVDRLSNLVKDLLLLYNLHPS